MEAMFSTNDFTLDCTTCLAINTTACGDCIVTHLLANDAGPIDFEVVARPELDAVDEAVALFRRAGLIGDEPEFVPREEFEAGRLSAAV